MDMTNLPWPDGYPGFARDANGAPRFLLWVKGEGLEGRPDWEQRACERAIVWFAEKMNLRRIEPRALGRASAEVQEQEAMALLAWIEAKRKLEA